MKIISGTAHTELARGIAEKLGTELVDVTVDAFPDGETFVKVNENIRGEDVFLVQPTCPPTNHNIMELLIMVDAVHRASAGRINVVIPFFGYARQDRKDQPRVPITAKLVANLISAAGTNRVVAMDLHAAQIQGFFDIPVDHLYAKPELVRHMWGKFGRAACRELVVVSPDVGGVKLARAYSDALGAELAIVAKHRVSATQVEAMNLIGQVEGRDVLIVDDMTETAGTLCAAAQILREGGARRIYAAVSHAVLGSLGRERVKNSELECLMTTDSTPVEGTGKVEVVPVSGLIGEAMSCIHSGKSVSSLFDIEG